MAPLRESVHESGNERYLGSDDCQLYALVLHGRDDPGDVVHRDLEQPCVSRDPGVARRTQQLRFSRRPCECTHECVLATSRSDDEYLQSATEAPALGCVRAAETWLSSDRVPHSEAMNSSTPIAASVS